MNAEPKPVVLAIAAHPDDIEFCMAGTLVLLRRAGWRIHCLNLASGSCGSVTSSAARTRSLRRLEAQRAAKMLGADWHPPICDDLEILYELRTLRRVAGIVRAIKPLIILTHSPQDYMEDHMNTCRLAVSATFVRGMRNFITVPARTPVAGEATVYHAMPHGLRDGLRRRIRPELFVNTSAVHAIKRAALACHQSQKEWLDVSQGMDSYLKTMDEMSLAVGGISRRFQHAEGWRRHLHLGFCSESADPLRKALGRACRVNRRYLRELETG